jgi:hypothetical protein
VDIAQGFVAAESAAFFTQAAIGSGVVAVSIAASPIAVIGGLTGAMAFAVLAGNEAARSAIAFEEAFAFFAGNLTPSTDDPACGCK